MNAIAANVFLRDDWPEKTSAVLASLYERRRTTKRLLAALPVYKNAPSVTIERVHELVVLALALQDYRNVEREYKNLASTMPEAPRQHFEELVAELRKNVRECEQKMNDPETQSLPACTSLIRNGTAALRTELQAQASVQAVFAEQVASETTKRDENIAWAGSLVAKAIRTLLAFGTQTISDDIKKSIDALKVEPSNDNQLTTRLQQLQDTVERLRLQQSPQAVTIMNVPIMKVPSLIDTAPTVRVISSPPPVRAITRQ